MVVVVVSDLSTVTLGRARGAIEVGVARVGAGEGVVARGGLDDGAARCRRPG